MKLFALALLFLLGTIFLPLVTNGNPPPFPQQLTARADGYQLVGGADVFVACAGDGTVRLSAYALRPDGSQGHTVFALDVAQGRLVERPEYRSSVVIRGSLFGQPLERCGVGGVLSVYIRDPNAGSVTLQQGS